MARVAISAWCAVTDNPRYDAPAGLAEKLAGRRLVVSVSGGKDSAAVCLLLQREWGLDVERIFMDTGWEHPVTYDYLRGPLTKALGPVRELRAARLMEQRIRESGMFPSRRVRWCTRELKVEPARRYFRELQAVGMDPVSVVGVRAEESRARSVMTEWEWNDDFDCEVWRPLIAWTEAEVIEIHRRHGLAPNPLYLAGARRVGCWPCINSRKDEVRFIAEKDPARVELIRELESVVTDACKAKVAARGEVWGEKREGRGYSDADRLGFFGAGKPIDSVVAWSRTTPGGKNLAMFAPDPADEGCMRWGMCEHAPALPSSESSS
jgi:3'-phosphoadenosine 5'-phosphosulfate sulfotransferase (PAPS reductase)/FAD synthetase